MNDKPQLPVTSATDEKSHEIRLLARLASGDMDAVADLYDQFAVRVFALARRILRDDSDAEEIVQEVFSQAWRTARRFDASRGSVSAWLLMMARTRSIDRLRSRQARPETISEAYPDAIADHALPASDQLLAKEQAAWIREALGTLPDVQRTALELAYYDGLTQSEIATRLTEPLGTIKTRIRTALSTLRQRLRP